MGTKVTAIKLTETERAAVDELVESGYFKTVSAALREGIMLLLEERKISFETRLKIRQERLLHTMRSRPTKEQ